MFSFASGFWLTLNTFWLCYGYVLVTNWVKKVDTLARLAQLGDEEEEYEEEEEDGKEEEDTQKQR